MFAVSQLRRSCRHAVLQISVQVFQFELGFFDLPVPGLELLAHPRYARFLGKAVQGDLGKSILQEKRVSELILDKLPATIELSLVALTMAFLPFNLGLLLAGVLGMMAGAEVERRSLIRTGELEHRT